MYRINVDNQILYHPHLVSEGYAITSGTIDLELDKTGSADITIPPVNPMYSSISKMKSMIQVMDDDEEIFRGRVFNDTVSFDKSKQMYVEGELGFMIDNILSPYNNTICSLWQPFITWLERPFNNTVGDFFLYYVFVYNTQVESSKQFNIGIVDVAAASTVVTIENKDYPTIWDEINAQLIDVYGGHIRTRLTNGVRYIDWLADYTNVCAQTIEFGVNLLDIEEYISAEDLITVLIPLGKDLGGESGRVNITTVNGGELGLVDANAQDLYGNIWGTKVWDEITDPATLKALGESELPKVSNPLKTITIEAVDLNFAGIETDKIRLGDKIRVISIPHGIDSLYQCSKMSINLLDPSGTTYTFGDIPKTITGEQADTKSEVQQVSSVAAKAEEDSGTSAAAALLQAKAYADGLVYAASNAYESDRTQVVGETTMSSVYTDLIDDVEAKIYKTSNGESRYKLGLMAQDISAALQTLGLDDPILTGTTVDYDELVVVLWAAVKDLRDRVDALERGS